MKRAALLICFPMAISVAAHAQDECKTVDADLDRLACYDRASGRTPTPTVTSTGGAWTLQSEKSKLTDDVNLQLFVQSDEAINCGWNNGAKITLIVRCLEKTTSLIFATGCHMTSSDYDDYGRVDYRIDQQKAAKFTGTTSTDNKSIGLWSGVQAIPVIKKIMTGSKMVVRMTPFGENPFTATFGIAGLDEAIQPLRRECKW